MKACILSLGQVKMDETHVRLIHRLKAKQQAMGLKQWEFARYLGISESVLSKLFGGHVRIGPTTLSALLKTCPEIFVPEWLETEQAQTKKLVEEGP